MVWFSILVGEPCLLLRSSHECLAQLKEETLNHVDLRAAFDTIDHQVLLNCLYLTYGITGTALKWFHAYLSNRKQQMLITLAIWVMLICRKGYLKDAV